jgi:hypothetical protein
MNKTFQLLAVITEIKRFITKDDKTIDYYPAKIINSNYKIYNEMINQKKEYLFASTVDQNEYEEIGFAIWVPKIICHEFQFQLDFQKSVHFIFVFLFIFITYK